MTDWRIEKFDIHHIKEFELRPEDKGRLLNEDPSKWEQVADNSIAYSFYHHGNLIFCGGIFLHYAGFGEAWLLCSPEAETLPKGMFKLTRDGLEKIIKDYKLFRVQATVRCDWKQAQKFIRKLGFTPEGVLRKYGIDQSNYMMYARIE